MCKTQQGGTSISQNTWQTDSYVYFTSIYPESAAADLKHWKYDQQSGNVIVSDSANSSGYNTTGEWNSVYLYPGLSYFHVQPRTSGLWRTEMVFSILCDSTQPTTISNLSCSDSSGYTATLSWTSCDSDGLSPWNEYEIIYKSGGAPTDSDSDGVYNKNNYTALGTRTTTSITATGLTPNTNYQFKIRGKDSAGNIGILSNNLSITLPNVVHHFDVDCDSEAPLAVEQGKTFVLKIQAKDSLNANFDLDDYVDIIAETGVIEPCSATLVNGYAEVECRLTDPDSNITITVSYSAVPAKIIISEIQTKNYQPGDPNDRFFEILNYGGRIQDLKGWQAIYNNNPSTEDKIFKINMRGYLGVGERLVVGRDGDEFYAQYGFYPDFVNQGFWLNNGNDTICLFNTNSNSIVDRSFALTTTANLFERRPDSLPNEGSVLGYWIDRGTVLGTPKAANVNSISVTTQVATGTIEMNVTSANYMSYLDIVLNTDTPLEGQNINITISARDDSGSLYGLFTGVVGMSSSAGIVIPSTSNSFSGGQVTQNIIIDSPLLSSDVTCTFTVTYNLPNGGMPDVIISEVKVGTDRFIELLNAGGMTQNLKNWKLRHYKVGSGLMATVYLSGILPVGDSIVIVENEEDFHVSHSSIVVDYENTKLDYAAGDKNYFQLFDNEDNLMDNFGTATMPDMVDGAYYRIYSPQNDGTIISGTSTSAWIIAAGASGTPKTPNPSGEIPINYDTRVGQAVFTLYMDNAPEIIINDDSYTFKNSDSTAYIGVIDVDFSDDAGIDTVYFSIGTDTDVFDLGGKDTYTLNFTLNKVYAALSPGTNKIWIDAIDSGGNRSTDYFYVTYEPIVIDGDLSDWQYDELCDVRNGDSFYITWDDLNLYFGYQGQHGDMSAADLYIYIDTGYGGSAVSDNQNGTHNLPLSASLVILADNNLVT
ncbi:lamin tail domain-containing protein, partial [Candidatus Dependentiae bacterium]|nr:lamin tail domain-containing protein [Candidatus Dependentiae bacterium]